MGERRGVMVPKCKDSESGSMLSPYRFLNLATLVLVLSAPSILASTAFAATEWRTYGLNYNETRHAELTQINRNTVAELKLAWSYDVPDAVSLNSTPLMIGDTLYFSADRAVVHAIDARTGKWRWTYDPRSWRHSPRGIAISFNTNRGIAYDDGKIYVGTPDGRLVALDAETGAVEWATRAFPIGEHKAINGAPRAGGGKVFIGNSGAEYGTRGFVEAYDGGTGERLWRFYTVPGDPTNGYENETMAMAAKTWSGRWWKHFGGGTVWNALTYDPDLELLYVGVGNGDPWDRDVRSEGAGDNLFLASIVALDANTGGYMWHYQLNPGEQWDYKATMDMVLAEITIDDAPRKVLMQAPTNGFFYVLDRLTGELLSAEKYAKATWAERIDLETGRPVEMPGVRVKAGEKKLIYPSTYGAHNWQPMSYNTDLGLVYIPTIHQGAYYSKPPSYQTRDNFFTIGIVTELAKIDPLDGTGGLLAWDPETQQPSWQIDNLPIWNGGTLSTAGGLVFHGRGDGTFVAHDAKSGKVLWSFNAQRGITAAPITYELDGTQYVTVLVGWGGLASFGLEPFREHGWRYKGKGIRALTFSLDGDATLPPPPPALSLNPIDVESLEIEIDKSLAEEGYGLYHASSCATCHGSDAHSVGAAAPDLRESSTLLSYPTFRSILVEGTLLEKNMPLFDDLTEQEVKAVFEYLLQQALESQRVEAG